MTEHSRWIVRQVQEQSDTFHAAVLFKVSSEESASFQIDTHSTEDNGEILLMSIMYILCWLPYKTSLSTNLRGDFVVWKTSCGKYGDLLTARDGVHCVDG